MEEEVPGFLQKSRHTLKIESTELALDFENFQSPYRNLSKCYKTSQKPRRNLPEALKPTRSSVETFKSSETSQRLRGNLPKALKPPRSQVEAFQKL